MNRRKEGEGRGKGETERERRGGTEGNQAGIPKEPSSAANLSCAGHGAGAVGASNVQPFQHFLTLGTVILIWEMRKAQLRKVK